MRTTGRVVNKYLLLKKRMADFTEFSDLPRELQGRVVSHLPREDVRSIRQTSQFLRHEVNRQSRLESVLTPATADFIDRLIYPPGLRFILLPARINSLSVEITGSTLDRVYVSGRIILSNRMVLKIDGSGLMDNNGWPQGTWHVRLSGSMSILIIRHPGLMVYNVVEPPIQYFFDLSTSRLKVINLRGSGFIATYTINDREVLTTQVYLASGPTVWNLPITIYPPLSRIRRWREPFIEFPDPYDDAVKFRWWLIVHRPQLNLSEVYENYTVIIGLVGLDPNRMPGIVRVRPYGVVGLGYIVIEEGDQSYVQNVNGVLAVEGGLATDPRLRRVEEEDGPEILVVKIIDDYYSGVGRSGD